MSGSESLCAKGLLRRGFTIIELLIVIVVIAILAAITVVAYNGIQTRANNTQTIDAVKQFVKAYHLYAIDNGDYPQFAGCLGEGYPAPNARCLSQSTAECWGTGGATSLAINEALKPYMNGRVPSPSMQQATCGATTYVGAYGSYSSTTKTVTVYMILKGNQVCPPMSPNTVTVGTSFIGDATRCFYRIEAAA